MLSSKVAVREVGRICLIKQLW